MSSRSDRELIQDILDAIFEIDGFVRGLDETRFVGDLKTIRAVELNFIVIGEAASKVSQQFQLTHPQVPWAVMKAMRNFLVHAYFAVDPKILWTTIQADLPPLERSLRSIAAGSP